ncbi:MAG: class I tRNA ligase family protein, partial [Candidatus Acidiferrum sp.]
LFAAPPEKDLEWSEESIEGSWRFLNRVFRLVVKHASAVRASAAARRAAVAGAQHVAPPLAQTDSAPGSSAANFANLTAPEQSLLRKTHQTLRRVTQDFEARWHFNSAIALIMELTNEIYAAEPLDENIRPEIRREALEKLTLMLAPMTPHLAEELWELLGHTDGLAAQSWPQFSEDFAREHEVEIVVQVNGRVRGKLNVPAGSSENEVLAQAKAEPAIALHLAGKQIIKIIFVPEKLVNLVAQ